MTALMRVGEFVFHNELVERRLVEPQLVKSGTVSGEAALAAGLWEFAADACPIVQTGYFFFVDAGHGPVNVFQNLLGCDAQHGMGTLCGGITAASGMLGAEGTVE